MKTISSTGFQLTRRVVISWIVLFVVLAIAWVLFGGRSRGTISVLVIVQWLPAIASQIMRVTVRQDEKGDVELALWPFYKTLVPASTVVAVEPPDAWTPTTMRYGYALFDGNTRGLLTGGPAITITTSGAHRNWLVSVEDPEAAIAALGLPRHSATEGPVPDSTADPR